MHAGNLILTCIIDIEIDLLLNVIIGAYAELLSAFEDRKSEGEKMHNLAESLWKNRRMSLADVLGNTEANISYVVDARISRLL